MEKEDIYIPLQHFFEPQILELNPSKLRVTSIKALFSAHFKFFYLLGIFRRLER